MLTHYFPPFGAPLRRITALADDSIDAALAAITEHQPLPFRLRHPDYLAERRRIEAMMYDDFVSLGGRPVVQHPYYFVVGRFGAWEEDGSSAIELSLAEVPTEVVSFTLTDSFFNYRSTNLRGVPIPRRPYHRQLYRLADLADVLERYELPTELWRTDPAQAFDVYVEAQIWSPEIAGRARLRRPGE